AFPFSPSRLLAPTELCARCLGPLMRHLDNSGFIRDRKVSKKSERWFSDRRGRDGPQCETLPAAIRYPGRFLALAADPTRLCANAWEKGFAAPRPPASLRLVIWPLP